MVGFGLGVDAATPKLHQDGVEAVDRAEVADDDPTLRFEAGAVFVADEAEPADLADAVASKVSPVASRIAVLPVKLCHLITATST